MIGSIPKRAITPRMQSSKPVIFSIAAVVGVSLIWQWMYNAAVGWINYLITMGVDVLNSAFGLDIGWLDRKAMLEEYYRLYFGPAAAEMKEFHEFAVLADEADFDRHMAVNGRAPYLLSLHAGRRMKARGRGGCPPTARRRCACRSAG